MRDKEYKARLNSAVRISQGRDVNERRGAPGTEEKFRPERASMAMGEDVASGMEELISINKRLNEDGIIDWVSQRDNRSVKGVLDMIERLIKISSKW